MTGLWIFSSFSCHDVWTHASTVSAMTQPYVSYNHVLWQLDIRNDKSALYDSWDLLE